MGVVDGFALFLGLLMGGSLGFGIAFMILGSMLDSSNNHGDSIGETRRYTGGIAYTAQLDKKLHREGDQDQFLHDFYQPLYQDPMFKNSTARVVRKIFPAAAAQEAQQAAPVAAAAAPVAAAAATRTASTAGFPSSTAFPAAPAAQAAPMSYQAPGTQAAPVAPQAPAAPTQQDYENYQGLSD